VTVGRFRGPIPARLRWLEGSEAGRAWLRSLPDAVGDCVEHWSLELGKPFADAFTSLPIPARRRDGSDVVLKVQYIDRETEHEGLALRLSDGDGAVRLLDELPRRNALLLERCVPGTPVPAELGLDVLIGLLPRLWKPATSPPFNSLAQEAQLWASHLKARWIEAGKPFRESLVDEALDAMTSLSSTQGEQVLLNQDLHGGNVLAAEREPWLVIDPKPLVGERELGLSPIIRSAELGHTRRDVLWRLDRLSSDLGLDRERARLWCVAQTVAWSIDGGYLAEHVETAEWLLAR
jgi:streptomycin 6-kinase